MTEDDTFRKLAQRPYKEVCKELNLVIGKIGDDDAKVDKFLRKLGWTYEEFADEWNERWERRQV